MSIDVRRDPRFDAIIARMQANSESMTPQEVLANALADVYIIGTEDGKQERDELRVQVEVLRLGLVTALNNWQVRTPRNKQVYQHISALLDQTPQDAAQYVRGLEEAIETCWQIAGDVSDTVEGRLGRIAAQLNIPHYTIAVKGDRE